MDVTRKQPHEIWLGSEVNGYFQKVEIENLPIFCSHCKMPGHAINECFCLHSNLCKEKNTSKANVNVVCENSHLPLGQKEVNVVAATLDVGALNCDNGGKENVILDVSLLNEPNPAFSFSVPIIRENATNEPEISSNIAIEEVPNLLEQEK
ncbi:hypothetical protein MA16_Dca025477 [Dendrobium catenatum]|uniref:Uncharacterized protein n=1 Tax=Dendrobium catenatum TaxID=906689 RepID=A0A2I0WBZ0_9ASPA|nr:hypothetical protein MA16_Dca025477 [Dendrobium catenatum]